MGDPSSLSEREIKLAKLLRPLGHRPMTKQQAERAAQLLGLHWTSVFRLRRKFLAKPVATSLLPKAPGRSTGDRFLGFQVEFIIDEVLQRWLPKQERLAHPALDISMEVRKQCVEEGLKPPARNTVMARWHSLKEAEEAALAEAEVTGASPGSTCRRQWPAATGLPGSLEIPMESFTRAVEIVLKDSKVWDGADYRPEAALWEMAVRSCGYIQARQAVSAELMTSIA
jgi:hypothetical protein